MLLRLFLLLTTALLSAATENEDGNNLVLDPSVTTRFLFRGTSLRVWSMRENKDSSIPKDWRFFYEPVLFPVLSEESQTYITLDTDASLEIQGGTKLLLSTNSSQLQDLAYTAVKMVFGNGTDIRKLNIQPLSILELNLTGSGISNDPSSFDRLSCFKKRYERPGQTVELVISKELFESDYISYSIDFGLDRMLGRQTVTCRNGKVEVFGLLRGRVNLREYQLLQQAHVQSQQSSATKEQLLKVVEGKDEGLKKSEKEILDLKQQLQIALKANGEKLENAQKANVDLKQQLQRAVKVNEDEKKTSQKEIIDLKQKLQEVTKVRMEEQKNVLKEGNSLKEEFLRTKEQLLKVVEGKDEELKNSQTAILALQRVLKMKEEELKNTINESNRQKEESIKENMKVKVKIEALEEHLQIFRQVTNCSIDWTPKCFHGSCSCYRLLTEDKSWEDASQSCRSYGSELVSVHSKEEQEFINNLTTVDLSWIGLKDRSQALGLLPWSVGANQWSDGTSLGFTYWDKDEPFRIHYKYGCVMTWPPDDEQRKWNTDECSDLASYICKRKL